MDGSIDPSARAQAAAWLALADAGDAQATWDAAAARFQAAVTPGRWAELLAAARGPRGPLTSRAEAVAERLDGLPAAPPGEYVVLQYHSVYDARQAVVETVTLQRQPTRAWHVVGYFIR